MEVSFSRLLMLGIFWSFCFQLNAGSVWSKCLEDQQSLLLQFKKSISYDHGRSSKLVSWDPSADCCSWLGVTCGSGGYVIGLDLSNESISGGIDSTSSLFDLHHLQSLDLSWNRFNGAWIPSGFGKLAELRRLDLSSANFSGQIPGEISSLTRLVSLNLSRNVELSEQPGLKLENPSFSLFVRNLTRLTELDLSWSNLSVGGHGWSQALSSLTELRVLKLADCSLPGPVDSLANLKSLSVVTVFGNEIYSPFPEPLGTLWNLTSLDISWCGLYGKFPEKILQLPHLQILDVSYNLDLEGVLPEFPKNGSLQTLMLSGTRFGGNLPESIGNLKGLSSIGLSECNFHGSIPESIGKLTQLVSLDFYNNNFSGPILSTNWSELSKLRYLYLNGNLLSGPIPPSLFGIPSLQIMLLDQNQFTGRLEGPPGLASSTLISLDLSHNKLSGPFPMVFSQMRSLEYLSLSYNKFSGPINLASFQQLKNLSELDLSSNTFSTIKQEQSALTDLDLSDSNNQISRKKLKLSSGSESLVKLNISHNKLQGELPKPPPFAKNLDYSSNNFSSIIPVNIGDFLGRSRFFSLSNNNLHGSIPQSICNATILKVLNLSNNSLSGNVPGCLFRMKSLKVLDLGGNHFSGNASDEFQT